MRTFDADFYRLKASQADLVAQCGGQKRSGEIVGLVQSAVSYVVQRDNTAMFSVSAKLKLERECGDPVVTRVCAELQGWKLERDGAAPGASPANAFAAVAALGTEYADVVSGFAQRTADGNFSRADGAALDRDLSDLIAKAEAFRRFIAAQAADQ